MSDSSYPYLPDCRFVYITVRNKAEALTIARALVEKRLAACVNILPGMISVYRWDGEVQDDEEVVVIAKTRDFRVPAITETVKALHSYDVPCVVSIPIQDDEGNKTFLDWIKQETLMT